MGKLADRLNKQLKTEHKKEAEDCIKIYNKLKEIDNGRVWESKWTPLVNVKFLGKYPYQYKYEPSVMGYIFLNGIKN